MIRSSAVLAAIPNDHARQVDAYDMLLPLTGDGHLRFLDLGAGDGRSFDLVREIRPGVDWIGLDIENSPEVKSRTRTDCTFVTYDGVTIPFPDQHFDVVFSRQVFEHVRYPEKLLQEIHRVLLPGGSFIGSVSQLEPYHSRSYWNFTYMGFASIASDAGLRPAELRPGIDGITLTLRNFTLFGIKAKNGMFQSYFKNASPLNLCIDALLQPESMTPAELAEFERLRGFVSEAFPRDGFVPKAENATAYSIQDINRIKLQYAGHICFRFTKN